MKTIEIECNSCGGTGLYTGIAERDGACVVCHVCNGSGKTKYLYNEFTGRKEHPTCKRVYKNGMGYVISSKDVIAEDGKVLPFSKEGVSYEEWKNGKTPNDMEFLACPMIADQGECHKIEGFTDRCNSLNGGWVSHIPSCKNIDNMAECWQRFKAGKFKIGVDKS